MPKTILVVYIDNIVSYQNDITLVLLETHQLCIYYIEKDNLKIYQMDSPVQVSVDSSQKSVMSLGSTNHSSKHGRP